MVVCGQQGLYDAISHRSCSHGYFATRIETKAESYRHAASSIGVQGDAASNGCGGDDKADRKEVDEKYVELSQAEASETSFVHSADSITWQC
jgi:hypothetical protein